MPTLTAHVTDELIKELDSVSKRFDRSSAWVVKETGVWRIVDCPAKMMT
jgi:predicted transcriptional regulator